MNYPGLNQRFSRVASRAEACTAFGGSLFTAPRVMLLALCAVGMVATLCSMPARADEGGYPDDWSGIVGAGVGVIPEYVGSEHTKSELQPLLKVNHGRFFAGGEAGLGVGYNAFDVGDATFGAFITQALDAPRDESGDPHLRGLGKVDATTRAALFATYRHEWLRAAANVSWDVGGNREGMVAKLSADAVFHPLPRLELFAGPQLAYGSTQYEQTLFGVSALQSARSGLAVYAPKSGLSQAGVEMGANYALSKSWVVSARATAGRLVGDSGDSPVVEKRAQDVVGVYLAYRF